jgi:hypothetical protein
MEPKMKNVLIFSMLFMLLTSLSICAAKEAKFRVSLFGIAGYGKKSGSASEYKFMANDFCIKDGYIPFGAGLGIGCNLQSIYIGLETDFNLGGTRKLEDPVEMDTVKVKTAKSVSFLLVLGYKLINKPKMSLAVQLGGGLKLLLGNEGKTYTSKKGYRVYVKPLEKDSGTAGFLGLAYEHFFTQSIGLIAHLRWGFDKVTIKGENKLESMPQLGLGLLFAF